MPYYDYLCSNNHQTEIEQRIVDAALTLCPQKGCRAKAKRLISRTNFQLKGNGWFANGYSGPSNVTVPISRGKKSKKEALKRSETK